jgi:hypothetical protein
MAIKIDDEAGRMVSDECAAVARRWPDGAWTVTGRRGVYSRNQAITAMTIAELLATGDEADTPLVRTLVAELEPPAFGYVAEED